MKRLRSIIFHLMERNSVGQRQIDDAIRDLGWHGFECILAPFHAVGDVVKMEVTHACVATYKPQTPIRPPRNFTAARIEGNVHLGYGTVPFLIRVGKGLDRVSKRLVLVYENGEKRIVSLHETGWQAHYRLLRELLTQPHPDMKLNLAEAVQVVELCGHAFRIAEHNKSDDYPFGTTPKFLVKPLK